MLRAAAFLAAGLLAAALWAVARTAFDLAADTAFTDSALAAVVSAATLRAAAAFAAFDCTAVVRAGAGRSTLSAADRAGRFGTVTGVGADASGVPVVSGVAAPAARALDEDAATVVSVLDSAACTGAVFGAAVFAAGVFGAVLFGRAFVVVAFAAAALFGAAAFRAAAFGAVFGTAIFGSASVTAASVAEAPRAAAGVTAAAFGARAAVVFFGSAFTARGARGAAGFRAGTLGWGAEDVEMSASGWSDPGASIDPGSPRSGPWGSEFGGSEVTPLTYQVPCDIVGSGQSQVSDNRL